MRVATQSLIMEPVGHELAYMPAHRQLQLFRSKELSPVDVLKAQIARIENDGHRINALTHRHFEEALDAAKHSETRYRQGEALPLDGISIAVKDEYDRRGWIVTAGSVLCKDKV